MLKTTPAKLLLLATVLIAVPGQVFQEPGGRGMRVHQPAKRAWREIAGIEALLAPRAPVEQPRVLTESADLGRNGQHQSNSR